MPIRNARRFRVEQTEAETALWKRLRNGQLDGVKFRCQHPVGPYTVDFVAIAERLIIELDGGQHAVQQARDERRTDYLSQQGYRVIRFWNNEVLDNPDGIMLRIRAFLEASPLPGRGVSLKCLFTPYSRLANQTTRPMMVTSSAGRS